MDRQLKKTTLWNLIKTLRHSILLWSILILGVILIGLEFTARMNVFNTIFPYRSLGMAETIFQLKWQRISEFRAIRGNVDAIIFGSSLVNTGIDPDDVIRAFSNEIGEDFTIFNYGVEGFTVETTELASQIIVNAYHPSLVILGTEMRDYYISSGTSAHNDFFNSAWVRYQLGEFSSYGFLISHSVALQVGLSTANWMLFDFTDNYQGGIHRYETMHLNGYECDYAINLEANAPIDFSDPQEQHLQDVYLGFDPDPERLAALQRMITNLVDQGISVVVMDMPINVSALDYYGGESEYGEYHTFIRQTVEEAGGIFIPALSTEVIPDNGWANRHHLNVNGAPELGSYLGQTLAELYRQGSITISTIGH